VSQTGWFHLNWHSQFCHRRCAMWIIASTCKDDKIGLSLLLSVTQGKYLCYYEWNLLAPHVKPLKYHSTVWGTQHAFYSKLAHLSVIVRQCDIRAAMLQDASSLGIGRWVKRENAVGSDTAQNIRSPENILFKNTHFIETALDSRYLAYFSFGRHTTKWGFCKKQVKKKIINNPIQHASKYSRLDCAFCI